MRLTRDQFFLGTAADNVQDAVSKGRTARGEKNGGARLTEPQVIEIRRLAAAGHSRQEIAECFGIAENHVAQIVTGKRWAYLDAREKSAAELLGL